MLVTIQQTKANSENLFEIFSNGQVLFQAKAPWMKLSPDWIAGEFGQQAADELEQKLRALREQGSAQAKKVVKLVGLIFLVLILLAVVLFAVLKSTLG